ncbi:MAG: hypothetical protein HXY43_11785 [Fischerella sp.]|uniref:hypothetical protein n=1 Tax=Fischerella sp. TaxID=1191 RepID=UPI0017A07CE5|nr:hypothetical protein [Fischerella sp.]NWF59932.1 hypothetical protein [Fischerella sp.]
MKNRHCFEQFMVLLSVSAILAISCPNIVRAQGYNPNPRLYSHQGRLFQQIDNRLYYPDYRVTETIIRRLNNAIGTKKYAHVEIKSLGKSITEKQGKKVARNEGDSQSCKRSFKLR